MAQTTLETPLRRYLDSHGIRYQWMAERLGITPSHLSRLLSGERPLTIATAGRLSALFNEPAATFLPDENTP